MQPASTAERHLRRCRSVRPTDIKRHIVSERSKCFGASLSSEARLSKVRAAIDIATIDMQRTCQCLKPGKRTRQWHSEALRRPLLLVIHLVCLDSKVLGNFQTFPRRPASEIDDPIIPVLVQSNDLISLAHRDGPVLPDSVNVAGVQWSSKKRARLAAVSVSAVPPAVMLMRITCAQRQRAGCSCARAIHTHASPLSRLQPSLATKCTVCRDTYQESKAKKRPRHVKKRACMRAGALQACARDRTYTRNRKRARSQASSLRPFLLLAFRHAHAHASMRPHA
eukprot:6212244-Pleurochrysis_carterae.AAC.3